MGGETLPYPIASRQLHNHYLQIRLREFTSVRFIEIRPRKEYTEQIVRNSLEVVEVPEDLIKTLTSRTNGNPTYIRETLNFLELKKIITLPKSKIKGRKRKQYLDFNSWDFKKQVFEEGPIIIESFCSMIMDQLDLYGQLALKVAAYFVSKDWHFFTLKMIWTVFPLENFEKQNLVNAWNFIVSSNILSHFNSRAFTHRPSSNSAMDLPYVFADQWMRICVFRKFTIEQKHALDRHLQHGLDSFPKTLE